MSGPAATPQLIDVTSSDGTALSGTDYRAVDTQVLVPTGATTAVAHVLLLGNGRPQPDRSFEIDVSIDGRSDRAAIEIRDTTR